MLKRTLVFSSPLQLSLRNAQLVVSTKEAPTEHHTIPIEDIGLVMIENQQITITMPLMNALVDAGVAVVLCDAKGMPHAMVQNMDSNNLQGECLRNQIAMGEVAKKQLWKQIIEAKIKNQAALLDKIHGNGDVLKVHYSNVKSGDSENREGIAARVYSVYIRFCGSMESAEAHIKRVRKFIPENGRVSILTITDKQYSNIINVWAK